MQTVEVNNLEELANWAKTFAKQYLSSARKVLFYGQMGVGKTTFIKLLAQELGVKEITASPTFALVHQYPVPSANYCIHHADLYRLESAEEAFDIGIEELFYDENYLFIEWPEYVEHMADHQVVYVLIQRTDTGSRIFRVENS